MNYMCALASRRQLLKSKTQTKHTHTLTTTVQITPEMDARLGAGRRVSYTPPSLVGGCSAAATAVRRLVGPLDRLSLTFAAGGGYALFAGDGPSLAPAM